MNQLSNFDRDEQIEAALKLCYENEFKHAYPMAKDIIRAAFIAGTDDWITYSVDEKFSEFWSAYTGSDVVNDYVKFQAHRAFRAGFLAIWKINDN